MSLKELLVIATNTNNTLHEVTKFELSQLYELEVEDYIKITKVKKEGFNKRTVQFEQGEKFKYILEEELEDYTEDESIDMEELFPLEFHGELHRLISKYPDADIKDNIHMVEDTDYNVKWKEEHKRVMANYNIMNGLEKKKALKESKRLVFYILMYQPAILKLKGII